MKETIVYPSSIVPEGSALEPLRETAFVLSTMQIEVIHIISFVIILSMIMGTGWYTLYLARKEGQRAVAVESKATVKGELATL